MYVLYNENNINIIITFYYYFLLFFFLPSLCNIFVIVCCKVWILGVWGELATWHAMQDSLCVGRVGNLACHERLFNPPPQFSRLGTWCTNFFGINYIYKCFVVSCMYLDGGMGERTQRRVATYTSLLSFLLSIIILGLACYKHTIHAYNYG